MKIKKINALPQLTLCQVADIPDAIGIIAICQLYKVRENRGDLQIKVENAGLNWAKFLDKRPQAAFLDALQSMEEDGIIRKVDNTFEWITYQICAEKVSDDIVENGYKELSIWKKSIVRYYKEGRGPKAGTIESDVQEVAEAVRQLVFVEQEMVRTSEVSAALKRIIKAEADTISMTNGGGVWFLATSFVPLAEKIQKLVTSLKGYNQFYFFPISGDKQNKENVWKAFAADVRSKIGMMNKAGEAVANILTNTDKKPKGRVETIQKDYENEKERIRGYAELLQQSAETLLGEIKKSQNSVFDKIAL